MSPLSLWWQFIYFQCSILWSAKQRRYIYRANKAWPRCWEWTGNTLTNNMTYSPFWGNMHSNRMIKFELPHSMQTRYCQYPTGSIEFLKAIITRREPLKYWNIISNLLSRVYAKFRDIQVQWNLLYHLYLINSILDDIFVWN